MGRFAGDLTIETRKKRTTVRVGGYIRNLEEKLRAWYVPIFILIVWESLGAFGLVSETLLPRPTTILATFVDLFLTRDLATHFSVSFLRAIGGFLVGGSLGLFFGLLVGLNRKAETLFDTTFQMIQTI
ncbi:MAG: ABC transporter permease, partial [Bacilli bacterium]